MISFIICLIAFDVWPDSIPDSAMFAKPIERVEKVEFARSERVLFFTADWCGPCAETKREFPKLIELNWKIGTSDSSHFQVVDHDSSPGLVKKWQVSQLPTLIRISEGRELRRSTGAMNAKGMTDFYYGESAVIPAESKPVKRRFLFWEMP